MSIPAIPCIREQEWAIDSVSEYLDNGWQVSFGDHAERDDNGRPKTFLAANFHHNKGPQGFDTGLCVTGNISTWEQFTIVKHMTPNNITGISLQNLRGGFLSLNKDNQFTFVSCHYSSKEENKLAAELEVTLATAPIDVQTPPNKSRIYKVKRVISISMRNNKGERYYLAPPTEKGSDKCVSQQKPAYWEIWLSDVPKINIRELNYSCRLRNSKINSVTLSDSLRMIVGRIGWAHCDIGFFHVINHRIPMDLFQLVQQAFGSMCYSEDNSKDDDSKTKRNIAMAEKRHGRLLEEEKEWLPTMTDRQELHAVVREHMQLMEKLADDLLYCLAYAQEMWGNSNHEWVHRLEQDRYLGLRALGYQPGPNTLTTLPHTDATWITLLIQDYVGGLQAAIREPKHRQWDIPRVMGGILCNTGNVLQKESAFYDAVGHRVERFPRILFLIKQ